jgi:hypothetical protein
MTNASNTTEQDVGDEAERRGDACGVVIAYLRAGLGLEAGRQHLLDPCGERRLRDAGLGRHVHCGVVRAVGEQRHRLVPAEQRPEVAAGVERDPVDADDRRIRHRLVRDDHPDPFTSGQVVLLRCAVVDDDLTRMLGRAAVHQFRHVADPAVRPPGATDAGGPAGADLLAGVVDQDDVGIDLRFDRAHPRHLLQDRQQRQRNAGGVVPVVGHPDVESLVAAGEDRVEALLEGVGEHERAGDEGGAEQDGDHGQRQADLVRAQVAQGNGPHRPAAERFREGVGHDSRPFMVSRTVSAVGERSSSTMRPSARNRTRSA